MASHPLQIDPLQEEQRVSRQRVPGNGGPQTEPRRTRATRVLSASFSDPAQDWEQHFSLRDKHGEWDFRDQPPELWDQYNTAFPAGSHVRVHPLLDWTELNIWEYIDLERIPLPSLYFDQGNGMRYRSLGCVPCTGTVQSCASMVPQIIAELRTTSTAERAGRAQDEGRGMEILRKLGHM